MFFRFSSHFPRFYHWLRSRCLSGTRCWEKPWKSSPADCRRRCPWKGRRRLEPRRRSADGQKALVYFLTNIYKKYIKNIFFHISQTIKLGWCFSYVFHMNPIVSIQSLKSYWTNNNAKQLQNNYSTVYESIQNEGHEPTTKWYRSCVQWWQLTKKRDRLVQNLWDLKKDVKMSKKKT